MRITKTNNIALLLSALSILALTIASCGKPQDQSVPRRTGYYRMQEYPAQYTRHDEVPLALNANSSARFDVEVRSDGSYWVTVDYYRYKASIYYTFTPLAERDATALVENRLERMRLDLGNAADLSTEEYMNPNGVNVWMVYAPHSLSTPVKFLALNNDWMVSGTAFLSGVTPVTNADSVAPAIEAITRDARYAMLTLGE